MAADSSPTVSVLVCTCDRPVLLQRALASVARAAAVMPEVAVEIIVVDDGEQPIDRLAGWDAGTRVVAGSRAGVGAARAAGFAAACGDFVAYCDDDDEWTPDHLQV